MFNEAAQPFRRAVTRPLFIHARLNDPIAGGLLYGRVAGESLVGTRVSIATLRLPPV
jgi:hypothetical protein